MSPRRSLYFAEGLLLVGGLLARTIARAQSPASAAAMRSNDCTGWRPSHDFRRVTTDSERVKVLAGSPEDFRRRIDDQGIPRRVARNRQDYDFVLDVPRLCIEHLELQVDSLMARVSLDANVADMVRVTAGAGVALGHVDLNLENVRATVLLAVDLTTVALVVNETMTYLDAHPEMLGRILAARIREERRARPP